MEDDDFIPPKYFELLDCAEQMMFKELREGLLGVIEAPTFSLKLLLEKIKEFCTDGSDLSSKKMLVCGVCWFNENIAINFNQIKAYLPLLKTTMNSHLQEMGYNSSRRDIKATRKISELIPCLNNDPVELKQWVVYKFVAQTPCSTFRCLEINSPIINSPEPILSPPDKSLYESTAKSMPALNEIDSFFDDPFSLPPLFLVEDSQKYVGESSMVMV